MTGDGEALRGALGRHVQAFLQAARGRFELHRVMSVGGMGVVLHVADRQLGGEAALKLMLDPGADARALERFRREGRALAAIDHPNVVKVFDQGELGGRPFLVMEFIRGLNLQHLIDRYVEQKQRPPKAKWTCGVLQQIADALAACHAAGIIHRDVKPANIVLETATNRPVLVDFGVVGQESGGESFAGTLTAADDMVGTPLFMAPEQLQAAREVDTRADLWALGVIAVRSLTGHYPFPGPRVFRQIRKSAPRLHESFKDLSPGLQAWVLRLLEKDPGLRPASPREALDELIAIAPEQAGPVAEPLGRAVSLLAPTGHRLFLFAGASLPFGRDPGSPEALCLRPLPDSRGPAARRLSRVHGRFETRGGRFFLTDTSSHGISRGGEQLERDRPVELYAGDGLDVGAGAVTMRAWPMEGGLLLTRDDEPRHALLWVTGTARVPTAILARTGWPAMVLRLARKDAALCLLDDPSERPVVPGELVTTGGIAWRVEDYDAAHFKSPAG